MTCQNAKWGNKILLTYFLFIFHTGLHYICIYKFSRKLAETDSKRHYNTTDSSTGEHKRNVRSIAIQSLEQQRIARSFIHLKLLVHPKILSSIIERYVDFLTCRALVHL